MKLIIILLAALGLYFGIVQIFSIREIQVVGEGITLQINYDRLPKTLLFFPSDRIRRELLTENPMLQDVVFEKKYPGILKIVPIVRLGVAVLVTHQRSVMISQEGYLLSYAKPDTHVPQVIVDYPNIRIGQKIHDPAIMKSLEFLNKTKDFIVVDKITIDNASLILAASGKLDILFTQESDIEEIVSTLQTLLAGFRIKGTLPTKIDLRFDKSIVQF